MARYSASVALLALLLAVSHASALINGATDTSLNAGGPLDTAYQSLVPTPAPAPAPAAAAAAPTAASPEAENKPPTNPVPVTDGISAAAGGRKLLLNGATDTSLNAGGPLDTAYQTLVPTPAPTPAPAATAAAPVAASPEAENKPPTNPVPVTDGISAATTGGR